MQSWNCGDSFGRDLFRRMGRRREGSIVANELWKLRGSTIRCGNDSFLSCRGFDCCGENPLLIPIPRALSPAPHPHHTRILTRSLTRTSPGFHPHPTHISSTSPPHLPRTSPVPQPHLTSTSPLLLYLISGATQRVGREECIARHHSLGLGSVSDVSPDNRFRYIGHLVSIVKPRKLLYIAIDGVAPRAKMNQQRTRRFRSANDAREARTPAADPAGDPASDAPTAGAADDVLKSFDRNAITPGTEFMARLSEQLNFFLLKKIEEDSLWAACEIVLSGAECPGEGEHKIME